MLLTLLGAVINRVHFFITKYRRFVEVRLLFPVKPVPPTTTAKHKSSDIVSGLL